MTNLRRLLKTPTLRLRDGGSSFGDGVAPAFSLGHMADTEQNRQAAAGVFARTPEGTSSTMAAPSSTPNPASLAAPEGERGMSSLRGQAMMGAASLSNVMSYKPMMAMPQMADGGSLRTGQGGHVPGTGSGDKIDAKYEPGEFVASNDMLDAAPGLREQLHSLRNQVLAAQGRTPEQANAQAVRGGTLRASVGGLYPYNMPDKDIYAGLGKPSSAPENTPRPGSITGGATNSRRAPPIQLAPRAVATEPPAAPTQLGTPRGSLRESSMAYDSDTNIPGGVNARNQSPAYKRVPGVGTLDTGGNGRIGPSGPGVPGVTGGQGGPTGNSLREAFPGVSATIQGGGGDMSDAWKQGKYVKSAFIGLRQLTALPLAVADDVAGGFGRGAFNLLRNPAEDAGRALLGMEDRKPAPQPAAASAQPPTLREQAQAPSTFSPGDATMPSQDPGRVTLRGQAGQDMGNGISKFVQGGKTLYSNVPGADNDKLMSNRPGVSTVPGMSREEIDRTLTNPDGSRWSAGDNAIMAANLRDGQDAYRGTSRAQGEAPDTLRQLAASPFGTPGRNGAIKAMVAQDQNRTTLRGQDLDYGAKLSQQQTVARTAAAAARADQQNKDRTYELDVARFGEDRAKTLFTQREQADKDLTGKLESMFTTRDDKGNSVVDKDRVAAHKAGISSYIGNTIAKLQGVPKGSPDYAASQKLAAQLQGQGAAALGEDRLQKLISQLEAKDRSAAASSPVNPFGGSHVDSADPSAYDVVGRDKGLLQDQYKLRNGSMVPTRALDYDNGGNAVLPNGYGSRPTTRFDNIKGSLRNE